MLVDRLGIGSTQALLAVLLYWTGTHWAYYYFREPLMVHLASAFWVVACAHVCIARTLDADFAAPGRNRTAVLIGLTAGMAVITRPTNGLF